MEIGVYAKAVLDFNTNISGELPLSAGDVVRIDKRVDANWLHGSKLGGMNGIFPSTFVAKVEIPKLSTNQLLLVAVSSFSPQQHGDLGFLKGDIIVGIRKIDDNWMEGEANGKRGIFPCNFVREVPAPKIATPLINYNANLVPTLAGHSAVTSSANTATAINVKATVKTNLDAKLPEEISLRTGETVYIEEFIDKNWCRGHSLDGRKGIFPKGFVEIDGDNVTASPKVVKPTSLPSATKPSVGVTSTVLVKKLPSPVTNYTSVVTSTTAVSPTVSHSKVTGVRDEIRPYGRTKYPFSAEYSEELSLSANQLVNLIKHIDDEWTLGELNGKKGIFPTSYVDIIVDCPSCSGKNRLSLVQQSDQQQDRQLYTVVYDFVGTVEGDLQARVDDVIQLIKRVNESWIEATNCRTNCRGLIPLNFLKTTDGDVFDGVTMRHLDKKTNFQQERPHSLDESIANNIAHLEQQAHASLNPLTPNLQAGFVQKSPITKTENVANRTLRSSPPARPAMSPALNKPIQEDLEHQRRKKEEDKKLEVRAQRMRIFQEILQTERDYANDLTVCQEVLSSYRNAIDADVLLAGLPSIVLLSKQLVHQLEAEFAKDFVYQEVGVPFLSLKDEFKQVYGGFCETHEDAQILLDKYETEPPKQIVLKDCLMKIQQRTTCLDLSSCLSRPIQRVLKYPLFLGEVLKCTEDNSSDKVKLMMALKVMTEVAQCINETKRRKDLMTKYRKEGDTNFSERLSRLNMHTFRKKSSRFSVRFQTTIGLTQSVKDDEFDEIEKQFRVVEKVCRTFVRDVQAYCEQMLVYFNQQMSIAEGLHHGVGAKTAKTERYFDVWSRILFGDATLQRFFDAVSEKVRSPVSTVQQYCKIPEKLVLKRRDKLLDFEGATSRFEKEKAKGDSADPARLRTLEEEFRISKVEYEAMNVQLKSELPQLCQLAYDVLSMATKAFVAAQRSWVYDLGRQFQPLESLVGGGNSPNADAIFEQFVRKHQFVSNELNKLTFLPSSLSSSAVSTVSGRSPTLSKKSSITIEAVHVNKNNHIVFPQKPQSETDRQILRTKYDQMYSSTTNYHSQSEMDISLKSGDLVGVIVNKDPMGNSDRWFVDNGVGKGFVPRTILRKCEEQNVVEHAEKDGCKNLASSNGASKSVSVNKRVDISLPGRPVSNETVVLRQSKNDEKSTDVLSQKSSAGSNIKSMVRSSTIVSGHTKKPKEPLRPKLTPERPAPSAPQSATPLQPVRSAPPPPVASQRSSHADHRLSTAGYSAPVNSDDEYSAVVKNSQNASKHAYNNEEPIEFYVILYDFSSRSDNELKVGEGQVVAVHSKQDLENNSDWWLVENEDGEIGYVPANYLKIYNV